MDKNKKEVLITAIAVSAVLILIAMIMGAIMRYNSGQQAVEYACIKHGNTWVKNECISGVRG